MTRNPGDWFDHPDLIGPRLRLTPLRPEDAEAFRAALGAPEVAAEVVEHLAYAPPKTAAEAQVIIDAAMGDPGRIAYAQRLRSTNDFIGTTSFYDIDPSLRSIAIGHTWLARRSWRTGLNTESKLLMLRRAFDELGAERVVWHTDVRNTRSQEAIARLGATREGVLRHHRIRRDGSWRDTVQFSMLCEEWPEAKRRLVAQLPLQWRWDGERSRYVASIAAETVAVVDVEVRDRLVVVLHTGVPESWRRCNLAGRLTEFVLQEIRAHGCRVRAQCSYTRAYLAEHPEFADLTG
jgi:RimJ/RimL family protein N-acetyltransferase